jgi:hypothetical protein
VGVADIIVEDERGRGGSASSMQNLPLKSLAITEMETRL